MLEVTCSGSPFDIGHAHGKQARIPIARCVAFYTSLFEQKCNMSWQSVHAFALQYSSYLLLRWPDYYEEMRGISEGAGVQLEDILALNVRTEIAFGNFSSAANDGCTALSWKDEGGSFLGQNWDWNHQQAENLIFLKIQKKDIAIQMITEAGIIGKIGMNSKGVGCTLNALKAHGVSFAKLPCHLALRTILESSSRTEAVDLLEKEGVASACHILVADEKGGMGLECSSEDIVRLDMDAKGMVLHTNHFIKEHKKGVLEVNDWLKDTRFRLKREQDLVDGMVGEASVERMQSIFVDEVEGDGACICRNERADGIVTLFSIVMDLGRTTGAVKVGRPVESTETLVLDP